MHLYCDISKNPDDKRQIFCDEKFSKIMGGESKVTMFTMNKFVSSHLIEKLPDDLADDVEEDDAESEVLDEDETESEGESD
jgi:chromatin remodeling complex protein RSC6